MGLELVEYIYGKLVRYFKRNKAADTSFLRKTVHLDDIKSQLTVIARAASGNPIEIFPAEREGGYKNNSFFLPMSFSELSSKEYNKLFYYYRVLYLSIQQRSNLNWKVYRNYTQEESQRKAHESSALILTELFKDYPATKEVYILAKEQFTLKCSEKNNPDLSWLYGKWMIDTAESNSKELQNFSDKTKTASEKAVTTTLKASVIEEIKTLEIDKKQQEDYVMTHNFEKVETADEFNGNWRDFDGEDELKDHHEAIEELRMKYTVRADDPVHSVYQADFTENTSVSESAETGDKGFYLSYDEWDYSKTAYKTDFCKLYPKTQLKTDKDYYKKTIAKNLITLAGLRKMLTNVNNKYQQQRRQSQGNEFDLDAITDLFIDLHSKQTPSENIYISNRKKEKNLSILILLDISLSSDSYAANNRILDVEKDVSILFGEILNEFNIDFCIDAFYSKTRNYASYLTIKDFNERWDTAKYKIGAIEPQGYTRIGAALRHAGAKMDTRSTKNKWVILISDGKPNDYDKYEGKYGINDVKQALKELNQRQINSYALAIEAQAKFYLPQMFGQNHYQILTTPVELLQSLVKLYEKIKHV